MISQGEPTAALVRLRCSGTAGGWPVGSYREEEQEEESNFIIQKREPNHTPM